MEILVVSPRSAPLHGGIENHVQFLAKELVGKGNTVTVVTQKVKEDNLPDTDSIDGVKYVYFPAGLNSYDGVSFKLVQYVVDNADRFDVIHLQAIHKPLSLWVLTKLKKVKAKIVFTPHYHGTGHTPVAVAAHKLYQPLVRKFIDIADSVIAVSDVEADVLRNHFPKISKKVKVIPNGIIPVKQAPPFEKTLPVVLTVGRLEPYKRVDEVIKNLPKNVALTVVGVGQDLDRLKQVAENSGKADRVIFAGKVSDYDLARWWNTADLFVSLSEHEAFGLSLGESITVGVPSLVSDLPAHRYVAALGYAEDLVNYSKGFFTLNEEMTRIIADSKVKNGREFYSWEQAATETLVVYQTVEGK